MATDRLEEQMAFILEVEGLKQIFRQTLLPGDKRPENDAEHSWHLSLMAIVLTEHARVPDLDLLQVLKMVLIHDVVEIDAGDTFAYDTVGNEDKEEREKAAADRLFNLLPEEQALELRALWDEFEERVTPEAQYAAALDRLQPLLLNFHTEGAGIAVVDLMPERNALTASGRRAIFPSALLITHRWLRSALLRLRLVGAAALTGGLRSGALAGLTQ